MPTSGPHSTAGDRRSAARTAVVWAGLQAALDRGAGEGREVLDIGGGTGGFAVPLAELGHRVTVVDPSPDALASLDRRARESGVADRVTGKQGDLRDLADSTDSVDSADVVLCHGVLEIVDDPAAALATLARVLRPGGILSLLVAQRHAAVVARAMAGHFEQARALLDAAEPTGRAGRRFTAAELHELLPAAGFTVETTHAVRVFTDLVPGSLLDLEPGASTALLELEQAVAERPDYLPLAAQLHLVATR